MRTFATLRRLHDEAEIDKKHGEELRRADVTRAPGPFYLGEDVVIRESALSPNGHWLLIVTSPKSVAKGFEGKLTRYVTESGHEEFETERVRVGRNPPAPQSLLLLNLADHSVHALPYDGLPGIGDDPLQAIREENGVHDDVNDDVPGAAASPKKPKLRAISVVYDNPEDGGAGGIAWSRNGEALAIQLLAIDNKDRWIASSHSID
jgi:hypothetical protein